MLTIVYAVTAQISIGQMLIAGLVPGLILASLYIVYIVVVGWLKPEWVPLDRAAHQAPLRGEAAGAEGADLPVAC